MKRQLDKEIAEDFAQLRAEIRAIAREEAQRAAEDATAGVAATVSATVNNQLALSAAGTETKNRELMLATCKQLGSAIYSKVITEVNQTIAPKLDKMESWVNYQTQDTTELITDYRRAVYDQTKDDQLLLTDGGKPNKPFLRKGVDVFFGESDY